MASEERINKTKLGIINLLIINGIILDTGNIKRIADVISEMRKEPQNITHRSKVNERP